MEALLSLPDPRNNQRLDRYCFNDLGVGCGYWTYRFVERLEESNYIAKGTAAYVYDVMKWFYIGGTAAYPAQVTGEQPGTFYHNPND